MVLYIVAVSLGLYVFYQRPVGKDDIYVDRLVHLKSDSSLFTGKLKVVGNASYYYETFCRGFPIGEFSEHQNGGNFISKGQYLIASEVLSTETLKTFLNDTVIVEYWQDGGNFPTDPYHFTVLVLKDDAFFQSDKKQYAEMIHKFSLAIVHDTRSLKYDYLDIRFVDSVYDWSKSYAITYELKDGRLDNYREQSNRTDS